MKTVARTSMLVSILSFALPACTEEPKKLEDVVSANQDTGGKGDHEFKVDQDTGKVTFKAEIVYFGFDDASLTEQGIERLSALASYMKKNPHVDIKVSGHCDERGSTEYNLALGHRRSDAVRKFLLDAGIKQQRVAAVSFGEENPAVDGSGENAWSKNRRAEFAFLNLKKEAGQEEIKAKKQSSTEASIEKKNSPKIAPVQVGASNEKPAANVKDDGNK